jgi:hypothetical protein
MVGTGGGGIEVTPEYARRAAYGAALLVLIALFGVTRVLCQDSPGTPPTLDSQVQAYTERYAGLRDLLPARGVIGYISESSAAPPREDEAPDEPAAYQGRWFMLTQYALAPLIVVRDSGRPVVICNVSDPQEAPRVCQGPGLTLLRDLGNGVALLRRGQE